MLRTEQIHQSEALTVQEQDMDMRNASGLGEWCHAKGYSLQRQPWGHDGWTVHRGAWYRYLCLCSMPASVSAPAAAFILAGASRTPPGPCSQPGGISLVSSVHQPELSLLRMGQGLGPSWSEAREPSLKSMLNQCLLGRKGY